jgi:hypothetical protein
MSHQNAPARSRSSTPQNSRREQPPLKAFAASNVIDPNQSFFGSTMAHAAAAAAKKAAIADARATAAAAGLAKNITKGTKGAGLRNGSPSARQRAAAQAAARAAAQAAEEEPVMAPPVLGASARLAAIKAKSNDGRGGGTDRQYRAHDPLSERIYAEAPPSYTHPTKSAARATPRAAREDLAAWERMRWEEKYV